MKRSTGRVALAQSKLAGTVADDAGCAIDGAAPVPTRARAAVKDNPRSEEHTSELQSLMRISYAVFCLKKTKHNSTRIHKHTTDSVQTLKTNEDIHTEET